MSTFEACKIPDIYNIFIDIETDGIDFMTGHIMEIAAVVCNPGGKLVDMFHSYVFWDEDEVDYTSEAFVGSSDPDSDYKGNGISYKTIQDASTLYGVIEKFCEFLHTYCDKNEGRLVFHNASFDVPFLLKSIRQYNSGEDKLLSSVVNETYFRRVIDTVSLGFAFISPHRVRSQRVIGELFHNKNTKAHTALADAIQLSNNFIEFEKAIDLFDLAESKLAAEMLQPKIPSSTGMALDSSAVYKDGALGYAFEHRSGNQSLIRQGSLGDAYAELAMLESQFPGTSGVQLILECVMQNGHWVLMKEHTP